MPSSYELSRAGATGEEMDNSDLARQEVEAELRARQTAMEAGRSSGLSPPGTLPATRRPSEDARDAAGHQEGAENAGKRWRTRAFRRISSRFPGVNEGFSDAQERDFVRRNLPMSLQQQYLRRVSGLQDIVNRSVKAGASHRTSVSILFEYARILYI